MILRERLIEIIDVEGKDADYLLGAVRCGTCKHWSVEAPEYYPNICYNPESPCYYLDDDVKVTKSFLCSKWES